MKYLLAMFLFFIGYRIHNWYGYEKGKKDPRYWRYIHSKEIINLLVNLITLAFYIGALIIIFKK